LLPSPLLYVSLAFKRHREEYYRSLMEVRTKGDWEGWTAFFLRSVQEAANDGVNAASRLFALLSQDRQTVINHPATTVPTVRLFDSLPEHPMVTLTTALRMLKTTKPTASKAIEVLRKAGVLHEISGKRRDRVYAYRAYLKVLAEDTEVPLGDRRERSEALTQALRHAHKRFGGTLRKLAPGKRRD
jgi:Fic family protein